MAYFDKSKIFNYSFNVKRENSSTYTKDPNLNKVSVIATCPEYNITLTTDQDYSDYYISPKSQTGTTKLSQPITEGITLALLSEYEYSGNNFQTNETGDCFTYKVHIPLYFHQQKIIPEVIQYYIVKINLEKEKILIGGYDKGNNLIPYITQKNEFRFVIDNNNPEFHFKSPKNLLIPIFATFVKIQCQYDPEYLSNFTDLMNQQHPTLPCSKQRSKDWLKSIYIKLSEELYQNNKMLKLTTVYCEQDTVDQTKDNPQYCISNDNEDAENYKFLSTDFEEHQLDYIPQMPKEFKIPANIQILSKGIFTGDIKSILFHGPAGTGKTANCKLLCQEIQMPIMEIINCSEALDESVLGKYIPQGNEIVFKESLLVDAIRYGGAVVFEEINFAKPQHLAFLNSLLDDNGFVILDNGEKIKRHPNFRFFATMNYGYAGTRELNAATYNRFNCVFKVKELNKAAIKKMLKARIPEILEQDLENVLKVYQMVKTLFIAEETTGTISPRNLENWTRAARFQEYEEAAEYTIISCANFNTDEEKAIRRAIDSCTFTSLTERNQLKKSKQQKLIKPAA